jgi:hypothetical protein
MTDSVEPIVPLHEADGTEYLRSIGKPCVSWTLIAHSRERLRTATDFAWKRSRKFEMVENEIHSLKRNQVLAWVFREVKIALG